MIVGVDPKIPPKLRTDMAHTFFLGECALATGGDLREIRNAMQLAGVDRFLGGCPPYEQRLVKLEDILIEMGYLKADDLIKERANTGRNSSSITALMIRHGNRNKYK